VSGHLPPALTDRGNLTEAGSKGMCRGEPETKLDAGTEERKQLRASGRLDPSLTRDERSNRCLEPLHDPFSLAETGRTAAGRRCSRRASPTPCQPRQRAQWSLMSGAGMSGAGATGHLRWPKQGMRQHLCDTAPWSDLEAAETLRFAQLRSLIFPKYIEAAAGRHESRGRWPMFGRRR
jgi:hypothetical protein